MIPHYGIFSRIYFGRLIKSQLGAAEKYSSFKKTEGPPYYQFSPRYLPIEYNDILARKGLGINAVRIWEPKVLVSEDHAAHH
jgi:hypothetical protein